MRSVAKLALGTALGIILAAVLCIAAFLVVVGSAFPDGSKAAKPTTSTTQETDTSDTDGDGMSDAGDPEPYLADSDSGPSAPSKTKRRPGPTRRPPRR